MTATVVVVVVGAGDSADGSFNSTIFATSSDVVGLFVVGVVVMALGFVVVVVGLEVEADVCSTFYVRVTGH